MKFHVHAYFDNTLMRDGTIANVPHQKATVVEAKNMHEAKIKGERELFTDPRLTGITAISAVREKG